MRDSVAQFPDLDYDASGGFSQLSTVHLTS